MICETCKAEGKTSRVYDRGGSTTSAYYAPFYDENGKRHNHDGNVTATGFECSNGHRWTVKSTQSCWCGWPDNASTVGEHEARETKLQALGFDSVDLLYSIDDVLTRSVEAAGKTGIQINGLIEAHAEQADGVVGLDVAANARPVELHPGTRITASSISARQVTGARFEGPK